MRSKKAIINGISSVFLQIVTIICGFIIPRLIISTYGSKVNGLITSISQFLAFITLLEAGFGPVVKSVLYKPIANKDRNTIEEILKASEKFFRRISYIFIIYIIVLSIIMPLVMANEFNYMYTASLVIIIAISVFAEYYFGMTYKLYLQAEQKTYVVTAIQVGTLILNTIVVLTLIKFSVSIQIVKLVTSLIFVLRPILQNMYVKKKYNINLKPIKGNYEIKQKWDGFAQHIAYVVHKNTDIAILTLCSNIEEISVYSVYLLIMNSIENVIKSFTGGLDASFGDMLAKDEKESLNRNFKAYEGLYITVASIIFISTVFLIVQFVRLYTKGITDVNYERPIFAYLMVAAEFIFIIRQPYNDLIKVAGHFKETRKGAWAEAIVNIIISIILVWHFGIIGVVIGTLVAMVIRTIEFMYHTSKHILERNMWYTFKRLLVIAAEFLIVILIVNILPQIEVLTYFNWIAKGLMIVGISSIVIVTINCMVYKDNVKNVINIAKNILKGI